MYHKEPDYKILEQSKIKELDQIIVQINNYGKVHLSVDRIFWDVIWWNCKVSVIEEIEVENWSKKFESTQRKWFYRTLQELNKELINIVISGKVIKNINFLISND